MSFTDADPNGTVSDYQATIDWGDSTTSAGIIGTNPFGSGFIAVVPIRYGQRGTYSLTVMLKDAGSSNVTKTLTTIATTATSAQSKGDPSLVQCATSRRADGGGAARRECPQVWAM